MENAPGAIILISRLLVSCQEIQLFNPPRTNKWYLTGLTGFLAVASSTSIASPSKHSVVSPKPNGTVAGWTLVQTGSYLGKQTMYISAAGFRMSSGTLSTIVRNSDQTVVLYSDKTKQYFQLTYDDWAKQFRTGGSRAPKVNGTSPGRHIVKGKTGTVAGIKAVQYLFSNMDHNQRRVTEEYWCADPNEIPPEYSRTLSDLANFPASFGLPMRVIKINKDNTRVVALDTLNCKKENLANSTFQFPQNYKRSKDEYSLLLNTESPLK